METKKNENGSNLKSFNGYSKEEFGEAITKAIGEVNDIDFYHLSRAKAKIAYRKEMNKKAKELSKKFGREIKLR